jgi:HEPN domain-containing protein
MATAHDLAVQLLDRAAEDEVAVRAVLDVPEVSDAIACFHAQQAVEKAIKAVMAERGIDFPFSHDLSVLLGLCEQAAIEVPSELEGIDQLTPYAGGNGKSLAIVTPKKVSWSGK